MSSLKAFHSTWALSGASPSPVSKTELEALESELHIRFPESYRKQILDFGLPDFTTDLWDWLTDREDANIARWGWTLANFYKPAPPHLNGFLQPSEIREALSWGELGMPANLLPFATDSSGNNITFDLKILQKSPGVETPVYIWDHDFQSVEKIAKNFTAFVKLYLP